MIIPIATAITIASSQLSRAGWTTTAATVGTKMSRTKAAKSRYCGARIGTLATQKV